MEQDIVKILSNQDRPSMSAIEINDLLGYKSIDDYKKLLLKLEEMEKSSRARRGLLLIREVKTNPYKIVKTFVINGKSKLGFMTSSDIDYIRSAEISINDRYSTGSSISKKKVLDVFEVKELISKEELEVLEEEEEVESIPKKDVSLSLIHI